MKRIHGFFIVSILLFFSSCSIDNTPTEVDIIKSFDNSLLRSQLKFVDFFGSEYAVYSSLITQQISGTDGQMLEFDRYNYTPDKTDYLWQNYYVEVLRSLRILRNDSKALGYLKYEAISKVLIAYTFGLGTDVWGDLPINNFINTDLETLPTFQSQEFIYSSILSLLDEAIVDLTNSSNHKLPADADLFYKGNHTQWIRLANFLKLKYSLRIAPQVGWDKVLEIVNENSSVGISDTLSLSYQTIELPSNPLFLFLKYYPNQIQAGEKIVNLMTASNDPRLPIYFDLTSTNEVVGVPPGSGLSNGSSISSKYASSLATVSIVSYAELKFIEAEVFLMNSRDADAIIAYNKGLKSSLVQLEVYTEEWYNANKIENEISVEEIINAKYVALFLNPETWVDWRRTGFPILQPSQDNSTNNLIPRRLPYPSSEYNLNPTNTPAPVPIYTPLWWDKNSN